MADLHIDREFLRRFEAGIDPRHPERSEIPARVLAEGRVCMVLAPKEPNAAPVVYKRLPSFRTPAEADRYEALHRRYVRALGERVGVRVMPSAVAQVPSHTPNHVVLYIVQEQVPEDCIGQNAIYRLPPTDINRLLLAVLQETAKVFDFNRAHQGELELGFDSQISNWALLGFDPANPRLPERIRLAYLDTSTPLMRRHGQEQLDAELFLRSLPRVFRPLVQRSTLNDLMARYYDFRRVALDLVAKFHKEGRPELIQGLADTANWFFLAERQEMHFRPLTESEARARYRWDEFSWRAYLALRKFDRKVFGART